MRTFTSLFIASQGDIFDSILWGKRTSFEPCVRALPSSLCVFQSSESGDQTLPSYGNASTCISRRLAPTVSVSGHFSVSQRTTTEKGFDPGICTKLGQIGAGSQSDVFLSGSSFRFSDGTDRPVFRQAHETANIDSENVSNSISVCSTDPFPFGTNGVHGSTLAGRQSPQASPTVVHQGPLVSGRPVMGLSHFPGSLVQSGCLPMAEQGFPVCHGATVSSSTRLFSVHGRKSGGLGSSYGRPFSFRPMVCSLEGTSHQCSRTPSSLASSEILSSGNFRQSCVAVNRHDSGCLPEQRREGPVTNSIFHGDQAVRLVYEMPCVSDSQVRAGEAECSGRLALEERADNPYRVDPSQGHSVSDISFLGSPSYGSVCHEAEQSTSDFHFSLSRPVSMGSGCHVPVMGGNDSICIPSHPTSDEGLAENGERNLLGHSDSSLLGEPSVLPGSAVSDGCSQTSNSEVSFDPASFPSSSSKAGNLQPTKKSAERVCAAKRASIQSLYNYRWNTWMDWCLQRQMDPIDPSVMTVADFLIFFFEEKKLSPVSVKGYRSAISSTLKHQSSVDFSSHPVLADVIRSLELEKPAVNRIFPHWHLSLVLDCLKKSPFEPMSSCSLKCLTQKTVFLTALASGWRRSEIHALSANSGSVKFSADTSVVVLHFFPGFLAKNQIPSVAGVPLEIPALSSSGMDKYLCPVCALRIYMRRTRSFRRNRERLFISYIKAYDKEISASTVSRWIVDTVRFAYDQSGSSSAAKICAHELRALSSSLAWLNYVPLDTVLRAGYWRSENSFIKFYLRDTAGLNEKLFSLGPIVVAQKIISSRLSP